MAIVESLYDLTTAIDDTNNDIQQTNNYEQIPFTINPSYTTKQHSTEVDTSVTEAFDTNVVVEVDTSAVVDNSSQQVVGNESLDEHIYSKPYKKDTVIETTQNSEDGVVRKICDISIFSVHHYIVKLGIIVIIVSMLALIQS